MADWEYRQLFLPRGTSRQSAHTQLAIHAQFGGWELAQLRLYPDGSRRAVLRRPAFAGLRGYFPT